jgi:hypothetical protein
MKISADYKSSGGLIQRRSYPATPARAPDYFLEKSLGLLQQPRRASAPSFG